MTIHIDDYEAMVRAAGTEVLVHNVERAVEGIVLTEARGEYVDMHGTTRDSICRLIGLLCDKAYDQGVLAERKAHEGS